MEAHRRRSLDPAIEILLALLALHSCFLFVFRRYPAPLAALDDSLIPSAIAFLLLIVLRVFSNTRRKQHWPMASRWRPGSWLAELDAPKAALVACFVVLFSVAHEYGGGVGSDGAVLFSYVRSVVVDGDLDLRNELAEFAPEKFQPLARAAERAGTLPHPNFEPGPVLFWLPFYGLTHVLVKLGAWGGAGIPANGYSYPYVRAVALASLVWSFVGVVLSYAIARRSFSAGLAASGAIVLWLASPLLWYTIFEPTMAHSVSMAAVAMFLTSWLRARDRGGWLRWGAVGLFGGLMLSVQRYNLFYFALPALTLLRYAHDSARGRARIDRRAALAGLGAFALALLVSTTPLSVYSLALRGSIVDREEARLAFRLWRGGSWTQFLFSSKHGLFSWTPAAYLAVLGLGHRLFRRDALAGALLVSLALGVVVLGTRWDEGESFGSRRLTEAFPIFLFGFCGLLDWARRSPRALLASACSLLVLWNVLLVSQVRRREIPRTSPFAFSEVASRAATELYASIGHPFAIPANWVFAWRYGVTPDRFDTVWGARRYHNWRLQVGSKADLSHLGRGWSIPERTETGATFRWSDGDQSSWLVSLFEPYRYVLRLEGEPARTPDGEPQVVLVEVNGAGAGGMSFPVGESTQELVVPRAFWKVGLNEIVLRYRYTVRADEAYGGSDPRPVALRLERIELSIGETTRDP